MVPWSPYRPRERRRLQCVVMGDTRSKRCVRGRRGYGALSGGRCVRVRLRPHGSDESRAWTHVACRPKRQYMNAPGDHSDNHASAVFPKRRYVSALSEGGDNCANVSIRVRLLLRQSPNPGQVAVAAPPKSQPGSGCCGSVAEVPTRVRLLAPDLVRAQGGSPDAAALREISLSSPSAAGPASR
jgi:hypothetical protein